MCSTYICYICVLIVLPFILQVPCSEDKINYNRDEKVFSDVIRNISRVNNILQELITNYEHLQKIYNSQENIEKDYSSNGRVDESLTNFKSKTNKKGRHMNESVFKTTPQFPATQIIWSDEDNSNDGSVKVSEEDEVPEKFKSNEENTEVVIKSKETGTITDLASDETKEMKKYKVKQIAKEDDTRVFQIKNKIVRNKTQLATIYKQHKSRFTGNFPKTSTTKRKQNIANKYNITKEIKRIVYSEAFSPKNIWAEILRNKPIQLKAHIDKMFDRDERKDLKNLEPKLRSVDGKTALVILTKNEKIENKDSSQSTEDEAKEIFKTNVLRKAYGDACLKVVVKKCYKACKHVNKAACARYRCKSKFKQKFKESSKTGCIKEFRPESVNETVPTRMRALHGFNDATRGGYLQVCHTHELKEHKTHILRNNTQLKNTNSTQAIEKELHILRDRYESACRRASGKKCVTACKFAARATCDTFACTKGLKKAYRKYCKRQCHVAYKSGHEKSSSESGSSSDTDSSSSDTSSSHAG